MHTLSETVRYDLTENIENEIEEIVPGTFLFKNQLSDFEKKSIIEIYKNVKEEFYQPTLKTGHKMNLEMTGFGWHWNPIDNNYNRRRVDYDNRIAQHIPILLKEIARKYIESYFPYHNPDWDVCVVNYYRPASSLGLHRDNAESPSSINVGHPVVSISIGSPCIFRLGGFTRDSKVMDLELEDGDILIMGGESRLRYHAVPLIKKITNPPFYQDLKGGRLNFTLRKK